MRANASTEGFLLLCHSWRTCSSNIFRLLGRAAAVCQDQRAPACQLQCLGEPETTPLACLLPCCAAISLHVLLCAAVSVAVKNAHFGTWKAVKVRIKAVERQRTSPERHCRTAAQAAQHAATLVVVVVENGGPKYLQTTRKGGVLATKPAETQGKGTVFTAEAVETQGTGGALRVHDEIAAASPAAHEARRRVGDGE